MKRQTAAALLLTTVPALAGAATFQDTATAKTTTHVKHLVLNETGSHNLTKTQFVGTDRARSTATGKVVGFDSFTGHVDPKANKLFVQAAFAFKGGLLLARAHTVLGEGRFKGQVTGGTGSFRGAEGTLSARTLKNGNMVVTLTYTL